MIRTDEIQDLLTAGGTVVGTDGDRIGKVSQVFLDDATGTPEWVTVLTGLFGTGESFIPLNQASLRGDEIVVPYDRSTVKGAPRVEDADGHLSEAEEAELYRYYGLEFTTGEPVTDADVGQALAGPDTSEEEHEVVLTEERPAFATQTVPVERVRPGEDVVTGQRTVTESGREERIELGGDDARRGTTGL